VCKKKEAKYPVIIAVYRLRMSLILIMLPSKFFISYVRVLERCSSSQPPVYATTVKVKKKKT